MKHFLFENREYKIDPRYRSPKRKNEPQYALKGLWKLKNALRRGGGKSGFTGKRRNDTRQKCTVKLQYSYSMEAHQEQVNRYLIREGSGKDGGPAKLYGTPIDAYRKNMTEKNFRIFLSPASNRIKLEVLAKTFIKKLELQTGKRFYWEAAEHYNTAHPHVHLLINGKDQNGEDIFFSRDLVKTFMRESARDTCTSLIGSRTKTEMETDARMILAANRYTAIDESLKAYSFLGRVNLERVKKNREQYITRLDHLRTLGLCVWEGQGYTLAPEWEETLKNLGKYNTFLNAKKYLHYTNEHDLRLYESGMGKKSGRIMKIYKTDEMSDNHAAVLESVDGNAYYIPLYSKPEVKEGDTVTVIPVRNQKGRLRPLFEKIGIKELYRETEKNSYHTLYADAVRKEYGEKQQQSRDGM